MHSSVQVRRGCMPRLSTFRRLCLCGSSVAHNARPAEVGKAGLLTLGHEFLQRCHREKTGTYRARELHCRLSMRSSCYRSNGRLPMLLQLLDDLGLVAARHQLAAEAQESEMAVALELAPDAVRRPAPAIETALFRVAQEALNNARVHAGPGVRVPLRLACDTGRCGCRFATMAAGSIRTPDARRVAQAGSALHTCEKGSNCWTGA